MEGSYWTITLHFLLHGVLPPPPLFLTPARGYACLGCCPRLASLGMDIPGVLHPPLEGMDIPARVRAE